MALRLPRRHGAQQRRWPVVLLACVVFLGTSTFGWWVADLVDEQRAATAEAQVVADAAAVRAVLEGELNRTVHLAAGLRGFAAAIPDLDTGGGSSEVAVAAALADVYAQGAHLRNVALAPDNVITHVHPLAGNEGVLGLRYEDVPEQWPDIERAMVSGETNLAGPVELVQGGTGLISRTPVRLADDSYWGMVSLVVDVDRLVADVVEQTASLPVRWAVRTVADGDRPSRAVAGAPGLFADAATVLPVTVADGTWELAAVSTVPGAGLPSVVHRGVWPLLGVLVAVLVLLLGQERRRATTLSIHDPLTGLPNRRLLEDRLEHAIRAAQRNGEGFCLLYLDLDDFKPINDERGHAAGDVVLREVGDRLRESTRASDTVARVGGDEFVVLLPSTPDVGGALTAARYIRDALRQPIAVERDLVDIDVSIGIAQHPMHGGTAHRLLLAADAAMYGVKAGGAGSVAVAPQPDAFVAG